MGVLIGKWCVALTAVSPFSCSTACSPPPVVLTYPMAWAALLKCRSKAQRMVVTLSKVHLPSYVRTLDDLTEMPWLDDRAGVARDKRMVWNKPGVGSGERQIPNDPRGGWEALGARVACSR